MTSLLRSFVLILAIALPASLFAVAQTTPSTSAAQPATPAAPAGPGGQRGPGGAPRGTRPAPTNIKALPKTISGDDLIKLMHQYEGDLGVQCEFCHYTDPATKRIAFPSDQNPLKDTARFMISMTDDLNTKYLADMPSRRYADPITCGTCHRGASHPTIFVPAPAPARNGPPPGPPAASPAPTAPATH